MNDPIYLPGEMPQGANAMGDWLAVHLFGWKKVTPSVYICHPSHNYDYVDQDGHRHGLGGSPTFASPALSTFQEVITKLAQKGWFTRITYDSITWKYVVTLKHYRHQDSDVEANGNDLAPAVCAAAFLAITTVEWKRTP